MSEERRDWWNLGLNPITGFKAEPQESNSEAERRYYKQSSGYLKQTED